LDSLEKLLLQQLSAHNTYTLAPPELASGAELGEKSPEISRDTSPFHPLAELDSPSSRVLPHERQMPRALISKSSQGLRSGRIVSRSGFQRSASEQARSAHRK